MKEFIQVTSLVDGKRCAIRAACIEAVYENDKVEQDYGTKPPCTEICYSGGSVDVVESYDDVCDMIYKAEL